MDEQDTIKTVGVTTDTPLDLSQAFGSGGLSIDSFGSASRDPITPVQEPQAISPEALAPQAQIDVPTPTVSPAFSATTAITSDAAVQGQPSVTQSMLDQAVADEEALGAETRTDEQIVGEGLVRDIFRGEGLLAGESLERTKQFELAEVKEKRRELQNLNSRILQLDAEIAQDDTELVANQRAEEVRDTLLPFARSNQAKLAGDAAILRALKTSEKGVLTAQALAKQGDIALAIDEANAAVDAKYAPYKEQLSVWKAQLEAIQPTLDSQEKKQAAELLRKQELADREVDDLRTQQKSLVTEALKNEQPELANELLKASTLEELGVVASKLQYGNSLDDVYKRLQIQKLRNDLKPKTVSTDEYGRQKDLKQADVQKYNKEITTSDAFKAIVKAETSLGTVSEFVDLFNEVGLTGAFSPVENEKLNARYNAAVLDLKEFFNLGVLNGPDLEVIQSVLPKPTDQGFFPGEGFLPEPTFGVATRAATKEGISNIYNMIDNTLDDRYATIALSYQDFSPESLGALQDAQEKYIRNKADIDPDGYGAIVEKMRRENPNVSNDDIIQVITAN